MDLSRRFFLGGALAVAASAVVPAISANAFVEATPAYPVLHGDGVTDDAPALNALFRGDPVICEGELIQRGPDEPVYLRQGTYAISTTLLVARDYTSIVATTFLVKPDFTGDVVLEAKGRKCIIISGCLIVHRSPARPPHVKSFDIEADMTLISHNVTI